VLQAYQAKENVIGYSLWTYCDIFSPSAGYRKNYGLVHVNFRSPHRTRLPKLSYIWYKNVIANGGQDLSFNYKKLTKNLKILLHNWKNIISKT
jgi:6-phospho-beta-glucosidase